MKTVSCILFFFASFTFVYGQSAENNFNKKLDSIYLLHPETIGIMVHIESPDKNISWSGAVGYSNKEEKIKLKANQPVLVASNTKTFVAAAVLRLAEQNKILLNGTIGNYLPERTKLQLKNNGYDISSIQIAHLLSHTSGINNFADSPEFRNKISKNLMYKWTRQEQIELAVLKMNKLGDAGEKYYYSDTNYLLLAEIMEELTNQKYYTAIRELINFQKNHLNQTWFSSLEETPKNTDPLSHQYVEKLGLDSYKVDKSFDLYGGGGLASTSKDLALFYYDLFNDKIFSDAQTLTKLLTKMTTKEKSETDYRFGIWQSALCGKTAYGHGGFWGTAAYYVPELNVAVSVIVLEKDKGSLRKEIAESMIRELLQ